MSEHGIKQCISPTFKRCRFVAGASVPPPVGEQTIFGEVAAKVAALSRHLHQRDR